MSQLWPRLAPFQPQRRKFAPRRNARAASCPGGQRSAAGGRARGCPRREGVPRCLSAPLRAEGGARIHSRAGNGPQRRSAAHFAGQTAQRACTTGREWQNCSNGPTAGEWPKFTSQHRRAAGPPVPPSKRTRTDALVVRGHWAPGRARLWTLPVHDIAGLSFLTRASAPQARPTPTPTQYAGVGRGRWVNVARRGGARPCARLQRAAREHCADELAHRDSGAVAASQGRCGARHSPLSSPPRRELAVPLLDVLGDLGLPLLPLHLLHQLLVRLWPGREREKGIGGSDDGCG